ncbi:MAG: AAA family ATPase [Patescibacteria group bacterium]|nr:AAA family ATPase [Patescibacteria group bacterium]
MTQKQALAIMKTGVNVYLTGSAGSGKTYLLNEYISYLKNHDIPVAITASTGIAATHMNGMTIHGWAGIGIKDKIDEYDLEVLEGKQYLWKRFEKARVLIIDEVSMLHAHRLDIIERVCRRFKRSDKPFGGLQIIISGDFFQLPPINRSNETNLKDMVLYSEAWRIMNPAICYLTEQHRQVDEELTSILNAIRSDTVEELHYEQLKNRLNAELPNNIIPTKLYTHNTNVDIENNTELSNLKTDEKVFYMSSTGPEPLVEILRKSCLASEKLHLKVGAEIMCIKNNFEEGYVNGTRGKVIDFLPSDNTPIIELYNGKTIYAHKETWAIEENGKNKASISQLPIRLAWAITIHKSQGMSLDNAEIDLTHTFAYGMGYVALSRVKTMTGIKLVGFNPDALRVDPKVLQFDKELRNESTQNELVYFGKLSKSEQEKLEHSFIVRMGGVINKNNNKTKTSDKIPTIITTMNLLNQGMSINKIAKERGLTKSTIVYHIEQIVDKFPKTKINHIKPKQQDIIIVNKANRTLKNDEIGKLSPIKLILEKQGYKLSFEDIRLAKLFINK